MGGCGKRHWNKGEKQRMWDRVWKEELEVGRTGWRDREEGEKRGHKDSENKEEMSLGG